MLGAAEGGAGLTGALEASPEERGPTSGVEAEGFATGTDGASVMATTSLWSSLETSPDVKPLGAGRCACSPTCAEARLEGVLRGAPSEALGFAGALSGDLNGPPRGELSGDPLEAESLEDDLEARGLPNF